MPPLPKPPPQLPRPTDGELAILRVLWGRGPSTVRDVQQVLGPNTGYTTVLKFMQIMTDKGLLARDNSQRTHVYAATLPAEATQRQLLGDLLERAFQGSAAKLVMQALSSQPATAHDLAGIRKLLDEMEAGRK